MFFNMEFARFKESRTGINLIRTILGLLLLLILWLVVQPFVDKMQENLERTGVQQTVRQLNAAINFKIAEYVALDKLQALPEKLDDNPMSWLDLDNIGGHNRYSGEVEALEFKLLVAGKWVFDRSSGHLIYKVKYPKRLKNEDPLVDRIQFELVLEYTDLDKDGQFIAGKDKVSGIVMAPVYPYQWF